VELIHKDLYIGTAALCTALFVLLVEEALRLASAQRPVRAVLPHWRVLSATAVVGLLASGLALGFALDPPWLRIVTLACLLTTVTVGAALVAATVTLQRGQQVVSPGQRRPLAVALAIPLGAVIALAVGGWNVLEPAGSLLPEFRRSAFVVYGTCVNDACGLRQRLKPDVHGAIHGRLISDGERIELICQRTAGLITTRDGQASRQWDLTPSRLWVSDLFVSTSKQGYVSRDLPRCPPTVT
jgi:hypothetical protein